MIDIQLLRKDPGAVANRLATRGPGAFDAEQFQKFESARKNLQTAVEQAQASRNKIAKDIGLADPNGLRLSLDACETYERLGSPEGELALAQAVIYLALAPKSNAVYEAYNAARDFIIKDGTRPVPLHIRNAPTPLMKQLGYGKDYRYAHEEEGAYAAGENYLPEGMPQVEWYKPTERGREARLRERIAELRRLDAEAKKK